MKTTMSNHVDRDRWDEAIRRVDESTRYARARAREPREPRRTCAHSRFGEKLVFLLPNTWFAGLSSRFTSAKHNNSTFYQ